MKQNRATNTTLSRCLEVLQCLPSTRTVKAVRSCLETGNIQSLFNGDISPPGTETDVSTFAVDYFAYNLLRKYPFKGIDRKAAAISAFEEAERQCDLTNRRLVTAFRTNTPTRSRLLWMRDKIAGCLGTFSWEEAERDFAWGPGATTRLGNKQGDVYYKFHGKPETTLNALPLAIAAVGRIPLWWENISPVLRPSDCFTVVAGSRVTTVPKDAKTDRTIAIEPCMNMYVQKGIGACIRRRLRRVGVNLNDQTLNQGMAQRAFFDGLCTVDLSAASDSVSSKLVDLLLPDDWLSALKQCRSSRYILGSSMKNFEKFSTMGNGYTFELESLIFWAITSLAIEETFVADRSIAIYGDDIICHSYAYDRLVEILGECGFKVNLHKSFSTGPFFESCGKHYFEGNDVTPVFVKDTVDHPSRMVWFANSVLRWAGRVSQFVDCSRIVKWWDAFISTIDEPFRIYIPNGYGDGGLVLRDTAANRDLIYKRYTVGSDVTNYQSGYNFFHWNEQNRWDKSRDPSDVPYLLRQLYLLEKSGTRSLLEPGTCASPAGKRKVLVRTRGWSSSWDLVVIN